MNVDSGSIPITWCLDPEWLENNNIRDYWVLLTTYQPKPNGKNAQWRGYCKLSDMMTYVTFYRPGVNHISASIAEASYVVESWMARENGTWVNSGIDFPRSWSSEEEIENWKYEIKYGEYSDTIQLDLPGDCFAPEPLEIEKIWVNWLWGIKL